jgi:hypothetical protein
MCASATGNYKMLQCAFWEDTLSHAGINEQFILFKKEPHSIAINHHCKIMEQLFVCLPNFTVTFNEAVECYETFKK